MIPEQVAKGIEKLPPHHHYAHSNLSVGSEERAQEYRMQKQDEWKADLMRQIQEKKDAKYRESQRDDMEEKRRLASILMAEQRESGTGIQSNSGKNAGKIHMQGWTKDFPEVGDIPKSIYVKPSQIPISKGSRAILEKKTFNDFHEHAVEIKEAAPAIQTERHGNPVKQVAPRQKAQKPPAGQSKIKTPISKSRKTPTKITASTDRNRVTVRHLLI